MPKARVYELAREYGVDSSIVLAELRSMGVFVRSAASTLEPPTLDRLRLSLPNLTSVPSKAGYAQSRDLPQRPSDRPSLSPLPGRKRREWYRGEAPHGLTKFLLDEYILHRRDPRERPARTAYWDDEVRHARELASLWGTCLLEGMSNETILNWLRLPLAVEYAVPLHRLGVRPEEVDWSYEDRGEGTLAFRLVTGQMTVEQVAVEVEGRRLRSESAT